MALTYQSGENGHIRVRAIRRAVRSLVIVCSIFVASCDSWRTYKIPLQSDEKLDQQVAIRLSRDVIRQAGYRPDDFELFPIREDGAPETRYFGTGPAQPPHGYVMWKNKQSSRGRRGVTVSIELRDRVAVCKLSWWH
jgi:hypothetical protein